MFDEAFWADKLQWLIWGVVMAIVMGALGRSRQKLRPPTEGNTLVHPKGILVLGIVCIVFFGAFAVLSAFAETGGLGIAAVFVAFALMGVPILLEYYRVRHTLTANGLEFGTLYRGRHALRWAEVARVRYSHVWKWFVLERPGQPVARISAMLIGLQKFSEEVIKHVPHSRIDPDALPILRDAAQGNLPSIWG